MSREFVFDIKNKDEIKSVVQNLVSEINDSGTSSAVLVLLSGELGAGKTTFTQEFAKYIGVDSVIKSPTYVLMKSYGVQSRILPDIKKMHHIDAYRLLTEEAGHLKIHELMSEDNSIIFIEWPEQIGIDNQNSFATIYFTVNDDESRTIKIIYK